MAIGKLMKILASINYPMEKTKKHSIESIYCVGFLLQLWYCCLLSRVPFNFVTKTDSLIVLKPVRKLNYGILFVLCCSKSNDVLYSLHFAPALPPTVQSNIKQTMRIEIIKLLCHFIL